MKGLYDLKKCGVDLGDDDNILGRTGEKVDEEVNEKESQKKLAEY